MNLFVTARSPQRLAGRTWRRVVAEKQQTMFEEPLPKHCTETPRVLPSLKAGVSDGERAKQQGMDAAASLRIKDLEHARIVARCIAEGNGGFCHADLVAEALEKGGRHPLGNAAGVLFQTNDWVFTGQRVKSKRKHAHANELKVWRLKDYANH